MHAPANLRPTRLLIPLLATLILTACGQGDGPESIVNRPATPLPDIPVGFCDPINFEILCPAVAIVNFNGGATTIIDNPDASGINTSDLVAQMQKFPDEPFGGTRLDVAAPIDFSNGEAFTIKVWSQRAVPLTFKLEQLNVERVFSHSGGGTWEELCFDFAGATAGMPNNGLTLIFDNGVLGQADTDPDNWTFYYDDITQVASCPTGPGPTTFSTITFDDPALTYTLTGFGGAEDSSIVDDPEGGSNQVVRVNRSDTAETFAGTTVSLGPNESVPVIPLDASNTQMTARVWSPAAGIPVRLKVENAADSAIAVETEALTTTGGAWETLTFDFSVQAAGTTAFDPSAEYNKIIIFFNFGTDGATAGAQTYYFDDIDVATGGGGTPTPFAALTFDDAAVTYTLRGFGGAEDSTVAADPTDAGNNVVQINRSATAETFAGTVVSTLANEAVGAIPLDVGNTQMTVRVYAPAAGIPVRLKIENSGDPSVSVETEAMTTAADAWETLTFDFANEAMGTAAFDPSATYDKVIVFFNFGTDGATAGAQTYFFDDVDVAAGAAPVPFAPIDFDDSALTYTLRGFGGAEDSTIAADPTDAGNNVVQVNRSATADTFAGTVVSTGPNESIPAIPLDAMNTEMTLRVYAPAAGIPVRMKIENSGDPGVSVETEATTTAADAWETLTFDFTNEVSGTAAFNPAATYDKVVVFFNFGTDGATAGAQTFLFDDIDVASGSGSGGAGSAGSPIAFESGSATFNDFEGGAATVVANPAPGGINGSAFVGQMQKFDGQPFAGSTLDLGATVALAAGDSYKMKVRAQRPVVVTFKLEPIGDERTATYIGSGDWEELCFDFTGVAGDVTGITLIFDNGTVGDAAGDPDNWTFQFDDIEQTSDVCPAPPAFSTLTFDDSAVTYTLRDFGGAASTVTNDPAGGGNMVVQVVRSAAAETFAGTVVSTLANEAVGAIPLDAMNTTMIVRVYSPAAGIPVRLKIENSINAAVSVETEANTTTANAWETLTFDFTNEVSGTAAFDPAATYDKVVVFFNFGTDGATAGEQTFYFDDVAADSGGGSGGTFTTITFDDMATTYTLRGFGGAEDSSVAADPVGGGNMVVQVNRAANAETFAGTVVSTGPNESVPVIPLDAMNTTMTVRVYGPGAGIAVRLKVEDSTDDTISVETEATTTAANAWETLTFDFANEAIGTAAFDPANTYDKIAIFFNFGTNGATAGAQTFYFDDVAVN